MQNHLNRRDIHRISDYEKTEHDQVVAARAKQLSLFYKVLADTDIVKSTYKNNSQYPDIIVMDKNNNILFIEEIETESSVNKKSKSERWINYSKLGYPFNLVIPTSQLLKTKKLIKKINIHKLYYYNLTQNGIRFRQAVV